MEDFVQRNSYFNSTISHTDSDGVTIRVFEAAVFFIILQFLLKKIISRATMCRNIIYLPSYSAFNIALYFSELK